MIKKLLNLILIVTILFGTYSAFISNAQAASEPTTTTTFQSSFPTCEPDLTNAKPLDEASLSAHAIMWYNETSGWQCDAEVTFTGKLAARSREVLNWLLQNYGWSNIQSGQDNPFQGLWIFIRNIVFAILLLFVLVAGFLLMITRGRSITVRRFLIRFIFIALLVWFSFSLVKTIYDFTDIVQSFFINVTDSADPTKTRVIQTVDLLNISFDYEDFWGYRKPGLRFDESAITSLILIKVTAATYYTMFIILIVRKIILWFFILVSPIFPLLLFVKPIRNTAKIWIGEFFRWVLYAPLFMIFLRGLVEIWRFGPRGATGIPLFMDLTQAYSNPDPKILEYPTAINILLGGPGKFPLAGNQNVNFTETFLLYLVALIMLWMVIIMPWLLLKIFLDMCCNQGVGQSVLSLFNRANTPWGPFINRPPVGPNGPVAPPPGAAGLAKSLPMTRFKHTPVAEMQQNLMMAQEEAANQQSAIQAQNSSIASGISQMASQASTDAYQNFGQLISSQPLKIPNLETGQVTAELLSATDLSIPTMQDIAKYEAAMMSKNKSSSTSAEISRMNEMLSRLAGTSKLTSPSESTHFTRVRERIVQESNKGNAVAKSMASAVAPVGSVPIPENNEVQQVNLDDYEEVKKTWEENYRNLETPEGPGGQPQTRSQWLKAEVAQIPQIIDMLLSGDPQIQQQGMQKVSQVLPFLLLGGFSKAEIVSYLKAKLEAAKTVMSEVLQVEKKQDEADTMVSRTGTQHAAASMHLSAEVDPNDSTNPGGEATTTDSGAGEEEESPLNNPIIASLAGAPTPNRSRISNPTDPSSQMITKLLASANLTIPTLRDIARFEAALNSEDQANADRQQAIKMQTIIQDIANSDSPIKQQISQEASKGNPLAISVSSAANPSSNVVIPELNKVQQVNLDDYQDVQNTWVENYRNLEVPKTVTGQPQTRSQWLKAEVAQIPQIIDMLLSGDPQIQQQGMQKVSQVLPFLLLGGFSKAEIVSYLKAKLEAAKRVITELVQVEQKELDEDSKLSVASSSVENQQSVAAPIPVSDSKDNLS
jgi:hypothetical protein